MPERFEKILIANRGEIAVRVIRAARDLGIRTAAIYSDADRESLPVLMADEAYRVGTAPSLESYLKAELIADLAAEVGADAVHPGYGFLAENADFARMCGDRGVRFIGPSPAAMSLMGSKLESRQLMKNADVPIVPGGDSPLETVEEAAVEAEGIGYPVMLKASAGGGGKGMRLLEGPDELESAYRATRSEAAASFGEDSVYLEKYIERPRHVEIQIMADHHGTAVALGERECSLQRRHQKVLEEAPSPVVDEELRDRMCRAAVCAAEAAEYTNAGTVEFLLARDGGFYFLEMNTRLQVEHPVTEMITGLDLVETQILVAQGHRLGPEFDRIERRGHAIEVRLYAEDAFHNFIPSPGTITRLRLPEGPGIRNDCGIYEGSEVTIHYDPMLGKLIAWGADRATAVRRLGRALAELRIEGVKTNVPLFAQLLDDQDFVAGELDIGMLDRKLESGELGLPGDGGVNRLVIAAAALEYAERHARRAARFTEDGGRLLWREAGRREAIGEDS
ncbi:MAG: acetyl/propionyl/methylcrotonyl-CoA carboxylase subunit alpha [Thermoanaerobaculia bacterium]